MYFSDLHKLPLAVSTYSNTSKNTISNHIGEVAYCLIKTSKKAVHNQCSSAEKRLTTYYGTTTAQHYFTWQTRLKKSLWRLLSFYKYFVSTYTCTFIYIKMLEIEIVEKQTSEFLYSMQTDLTFCRHVNSGSCWLRVCYTTEESFSCFTFSVQYSLHNSGNVG